MVADVTSLSGQSVISQYAKSYQQNANPQQGQKDAFKVDNTNPKPKNAPTTQTQKANITENKEVNFKSKNDSHTNQGSIPQQRGSLIDVLA